MESRNNRFFNIQFDKIKTIEEVFNPTEYVYDLTVEDTRNFNIYNGLCERDTFHYAGVSEKSNVTRGVPRLKELLHISKTIKIPSLNIYLDDEHRYNKDKALTLLNRIELTKLKDITNSIRIYYDPDDYNTNITEDVTLMEIYKIFNGLDACMRDEENATGSEWIIRFEFDKQKMVEKDITMEDIYHRINVTYGEDISCIYSDDNSSKLVFRIRIIKMRKSDADKDLINNLNTLKAYAKAMRDNVIIKGIENIVNVSMYKNQNNFEYINKSFNQRDEWVLDTHGVNLLKVLMYPGVDYTRTISNDIYEVYEIFGIEAAKTVLMNEIKQVIEGAGSYVNFRHVALLVDTMTNRGYLMSIDRFGINRGNIGPLAKCSFEETTDQLFKASIFGEVDKLNGVSANIMMGQIPPCGTGDSEILLDETKLFEIEPDEDVELDDIEDWGELDYCEENVNIDFDIDNVGEKNIELDEMVKVEIETKIN